MTTNEPPPEEATLRFTAGTRVPHVTRADHLAAGLAERGRLPRVAHATWEPAPDRRDPVAILEEQAATRVPELVPIRYGRMLVSPFTFYRGAAALMAADLAVGPRTTLKVQLCGDAHLSNFGVFSSPERTLVFDLNDFDETLPGPFEWDVKRLAASFVVAGRTIGWKSAFTQQALGEAVTTYRSRMREYADMGPLDTWYARIAVEDLSRIMVVKGQRAAAALELIQTRALRRDNLGALNKLTEIGKNGQRRFRDTPPLLSRVDSPDVEEVLRETFRAYRQTLSPDLRQLLARYRFVDLARKVVGVGSVGTRCWVAYMEGPAGEPLFLQVKEANASVLEAYLGKPPERHHGQRVVRGQKLMQAASDVFLGWVTGPNGYQYYWRQLWDAKLSLDVELAQPNGILAYARACGWALARAHARSGNAAAIAAYVGSKDRFDRAMLEFGQAYADQNERDYAALQAAVADGRVVAQTGI